MNIRGAFRVLCLASDVSWNKQLAFDAETFEIAAQLAAGETGADVLWDPTFAPRRNALLRYLWESRPQAVHFLAHGSARDGIVLADDQGHARHIDDQGLCALLGAFKENRVRLLVLGACFTHAQVMAATRHADCVVATDTQPPPRASVLFCVTFHRALSFGHSVAEAFDEAVGALQAGGFDMRDTLHLHARAGCDPASVHLLPCLFTQDPSTQWPARGMEVRPPLASLLQNAQRASSTPPPCEP